MSQTLNLKIYKNNQFLEAKTLAQDVQIEARTAHDERDDGLGDQLQ